jgi:hypothetical protein
LKLNITTVLLLGVLGVGGWMLFKTKMSAQPVSPAANPQGGATKTEAPDLVSSITGAVNSIFGAVTAISQAVPKSN